MLTFTLYNFYLVTVHVFIVCNGHDKQKKNPLIGIVKLVVLPGINFLNKKNE